MLRDSRSLLAALELDPNTSPWPLDLDNRFPLRLSQSFLARIQKRNWHDPLLRQVLPLACENETSPGYIDDPLGEAAANPAPGIVHKYSNRVLLITTPACAIHCRYCFRREFPYNDNRNKQEEWQQALDYVRQRPEIDEVILSGGDPLTASDEYLTALIEAIAAIPHVRTLRIHSRLPIVLPARMLSGLPKILGDAPLKVVMVVHANHAQEINAEVALGLRRLREAGVQMLNQSVLLRGVNDSCDALLALSHALFQEGVMPYYLHLLDPVTGTRHFDVPAPEAEALIREMRAATSGYLVPKLVREEAGEANKTPIA